MHLDYKITEQYVKQPKILYLLFIFFTYCSNSNAAIDIERCIYDEGYYAKCTCLSSFNSELQPDSSEKKFRSFKNTYLGIATGIKYHSIGGEKETDLSPSLLLSIMFNINEKNASFIGLESKYFKYGWDTKHHIKDVFSLTPYYQLNYNIYNRLNLLTQIGITLLSNNPALLFSNSLSLGIDYNFNSVIIFVKNDFNINFIVLTNVTTIINMGIYIAL